MIRLCLKLPACVFVVYIIKGHWNLHVQQIYWLSRYVRIKSLMETYLDLEKCTHHIYRSNNNAG